MYEKQKNMSDFEIKTTLKGLALGDVKSSIEEDCVMYLIIIVYLITFSLDNCWILS